jgi:hypothetical protein
MARQVLYLNHGGLWHFASGGGAPVHHASFAAWCVRHPGARADLVLAGALTHHLAVNDAALPLVDEADVADYARQQFVHYHGSAAQDWPLAVWADGSLYVACALHGLDLATLRADAAQHGVHIRRVQPGWAVALRVALRDDPAWAARPRQALMLVDGTYASWVVCARGRVERIHARRLPAARAGDMAALMNELQQGDAVEPAATLAIACGLLDRDERMAGAGLRASGRFDSPQPAREWVAA